jgi:hypothetical protein
VVPLIAKRARTLAPVLGLLLAAAGSAAEPAGLGGHPVCEASAALFVPCPGESGRECLLVGDNEERQRLFLYPFDDGKLAIAERREVDITPLLASEEEYELSDIEALARLSDGEILVHGSYSRNKNCARRKKRRRTLGLKLGPDGASAGRIGVLRTSKGGALGEAFGRRPGGDLALVAEAVRAGEDAADAGRCDQAFNLEGAVVISSGAKDEVWVGLRRPLVNGHAALLRQDLAAGRLSFDEARLVDLGGEGVRALSLADGQVWGLSARPGGAHALPFVLWRFPRAALDGASPISVEAVADVPGSAEGLAISGSRAVIVIDGDQGDGRCRRDARYVVVPLPSR